jgi:hypothetical protein
MFQRSRIRTLSLCLLCALFVLQANAATGSASWNGILTDGEGKPIGDAVLILHAPNSRLYTSTTVTDGKFAFADIASGTYEVAVKIAEKEWKSTLVVKDASPLTMSLQIPSIGQELRILPSIAEAATAQATGGEHLSGTEVSSLPLNARDFSKLLLLAAGTVTDTNGAANFTQQFAVNGQRGSATVFATDGFDTTDAEMGGATFSNFNVDAIQEVQSNSGVMAAEIGHGAAGFTNVVTKSGINPIHGSLFEFARNAAFDARNYFDHNVPNGRRIPPFVRNEFGFTNGGPVVLPNIYDGRNKTFYFGEYQGFRQVLGTTQVMPVPTADERLGIDTTTFPEQCSMGVCTPGDTLFVTVNPAV